mmetsp:Transcript_34996/g.82985  ORF Transcript_34996/g.82985 Transcript_34996/m.82985 type:complete len:253 (-) Transcript_34996:859-1617(-)
MDLPPPPMSWRRAGQNPSRHSLPWDAMERRQQSHHRADKAELLPTALVEFRDLARRQSRLAHCFVRHHDDLRECRRPVGQPVLLADAFEDLRHTAQVVARHPREAVVLDLKLEAAVEPVEPPRAAPVGRPLQLHLEELAVLRDALVGLRGPVAARDLQVEHPEGGVAEEDKRGRLRPRRELKRQRADPCEVRGEGQRLVHQRHVALRGAQEEDRLPVEGPFREAEDRDPVEVLVGDQALGRLVEDHRRGVVL